MPLKFLYSLSPLKQCNTHTMEGCAKDIKPVSHNYYFGNPHFFSTNITFIPTNKGLHKYTNNIQYLDISKCANCS